MRVHTLTLRSLLATAGLTAVLGTAMSAPAQAMPARFADAGTIVWCDGEGGSLTATDTTMAGTAWSAGMLTGETFASASGEPGFSTATASTAPSPRTPTTAEQSSA